MREGKGYRAVGRLLSPPHQATKSPPAMCVCPGPRAKRQGLGCQAEGRKTRFTPTSRHRVIGWPGPEIVPYLPKRQANHQRESQSGRLIIRDSRHQDVRTRSKLVAFHRDSRRSRSSVSCILCMHDTDS